MLWFRVTEFKFYIMDTAKDFIVKIEQSIHEVSTHSVIKSGKNYYIQ